MLVYVQLDWDILRSVQEDGLLGSAIGCVTLAETHLAQLQYDRGFVMAMMAAEFAIKLHGRLLCTDLLGLARISS